jgi:hypothetical protein
MAGLYVIEFFIHAFNSPDLDVFNGLKCDLALRTIYQIKARANSDYNRIPPPSFFV